MLQFRYQAMVALLMGSSWAYGALSSNLIGGGNFEDFSTKVFTADSGEQVTDYTYFKREHSPRTQAEIDAGATRMRAWLFHPEFDLGRWITNWGIGSDNYDNQKGIGTYANPRSYWNGSAWTAAVNNINISQDPLNSSNHVAEGVFFRSWMTQVVRAPANHVAGQATIDFSYFFNQWEPDPVGPADSIFHVWIGGLNEDDLPGYLSPGVPVRAGPAFGGNLDGSDSGTGGKWSLNPLWDSPDWNTWGWNGIGSNKPDIGSLGQQWHSFSADHPTLTSFQIDTPYEYYYISVWQCVYSEPHDYFWYYQGKPSNQMAVAIDNIDFRVSVASAVLRGDVNLDGLINALDISPFVNRLTSGTYQAEADINQDNLVNALDISGFVTCLVNGACAGEAGGSAVPEPASLGVVLLGALAMGRWRGRAGPGPV